MTGDTQSLVELTGADGEVYRCKILGVFEYDAQEYALLLNPGAGNGTDEEAPTTVLMALDQDGELARFRTIDDDGEYGRVMAFVREVAREMDAAAGR